MAATATAPMATMAPVDIPVEAAGACVVVVVVVVVVCFVVVVPPVAPVGPAGGVPPPPNFTGPTPPARNTPGSVVAGGTHPLPVFMYCAALNEYPVGQGEIVRMCTHALPFQRVPAGQLCGSHGPELVATAPRSEKLVTPSLPLPFGLTSTAP